MAVFVLTVKSYKSFHDHSDGQNLSCDVEILIDNWGDADIFNVQTPFSTGPNRKTDDLLEYLFKFFISI